MREPATRGKLLAAGVDPEGLTTAEFVAFVARERDSYAKIAQAQNIKVDD